MSNVTSLIVPRIHASHDEAQKFNEELELLQQRRRILVARLKAEAEAIYSQLSKSYVFEVRDAKDERYLAESVRQAEPIRFVKRWVNKREFDNVTRIYGVSCGADIPEVVCSSLYFRVNGVLVTLIGTGKHVLKVPQPCTEEEWDELKQGNIPAKFAA